MDAAQNVDRKKAAQKRVRTFLRICPLWLAIACLGSPALAQNAEGTIQYRQNLMSAIGSDMGAIGDIMKFQLPLVANIKTHAANIASNSGLIASAFKADVSQGATDAKADIWQDWSAFEASANELQQAAQKLSDAVASGAETAAVVSDLKALGRACGSCHKKFRKPKEESYKRK